MTPEQWTLVKDLFHQALDWTPRDRPAKLDRCCGSDIVVRREVDSLLTSYACDPSFLELPVLGEAVQRRGADPRLNARLGSYRIVRLLGEGGMGAVYLGVRDDDAYRKEVAIKLLRRDRWSAAVPPTDLLQRFRRERQTLADLDHPNITRLLDGGATGDGCPFLVMEHIEGRPIDVHCDAARLDITGRLRLFLHVCDAVENAHRHLVIHRDLKPGNILVTPQGVVKLLDFGIAKLLDESDAQEGTNTRPAFQPHTPHYASPEQICGRPVTTASDVYSLGVVLCELLSGHLPYELQSIPLHEVGAAICETPPMRPSMAMMHIEQRMTTTGGTGITTITPQLVSACREGSPQRLFRRLRGDLDMIVLQALRKEPDRRYASVAQMSEDIRRHLQGLPVRARPDTLGYRSRKFAARHPIGIALTSLVLVLLAGAVVSVFHSANLANQERDTALVARSEAEALANFLSEMLASVDPALAARQDVTVRHVLDRAAEDIGTAFMAQPLVEATLRTTLGNTYRALGLYDAARPHLEAALLLRRRHLGKDHPDIAAALNGLGVLMKDSAEYEAAEPLLREALDIRRRHFGGSHPEVAVSLNNLGLLVLSRGDYDAAESLMQEALRLREANFATDARFAGDLALSLNNLAGMPLRRGDLQSAESLYRRAIEIRRSLRHPAPLALAESLNNLAVVLERRRDLEAAEPLYREVLEIRRRLLPGEHPALAQSLNNLALLLKKQEKPEEALTLLEQALAMNSKLLGPQHPTLAANVNNLAGVYRDLGDWVRAEALLRESLAMRLATFGEDHPEVAQSRNTLGELLCAVGDHVAAESLFTAALEARLSCLGTTHPDTLRTMDKLASVFMLMGKIEEARRIRAERIAALHKVAQLPEVSAMHINNFAWEMLACEPADLRDAKLGMELALRAAAMSAAPNPVILDTLALAYQRQGDVVQAAELQRKALELLPPQNVAPRAGMLGRLVGQYAELQEWLAIDQLIAELVAEVQSPARPKRILASAALEAVGLALLEFARYPQAETVFRASLDAKADLVRIGDRALPASVEGLADALVKQDRREEALEWLSASLHIVSQDPRLPESVARALEARVSELASAP